MTDTFTQGVIITHERNIYISGTSVANVETTFDCTVSLGETEIKINEIVYSIKVIIN